LNNIVIKNVDSFKEGVGKMVIANYLMVTENYFGASHLKFVKLPLKKGSKLHEYEVHNIRFHMPIGTIHWRGGWREYVFQSLPKVDMSRSCQKEIISFIDNLMDEWKNARKRNC